MLNEIPEEGLKSFVLCNERFGKYITIQDFIDAGECLSTQNEVHNTLGNRVQACLEGKVTEPRRK